jgi:hypothetical protein
MAGLLSKGITLSYRNDDGEFVTLPNLQEIAEIGNNAPEKIDVTTLSDDTKKSIAGLADTAQDLPFKFLYEKSEFEAVIALNGSKMWLVTLPDGMKAHFNATPSVKIAGAGVSAPVTYTLMLSVESKVEWGEPPAVNVPFTIDDQTNGSGVNTYTVPAGTTWAEFIESGAALGDYSFHAVSIEGEEKISVEQSEGVFLTLNGTEVKTTDTIIAAEYKF